MTDYKQGDKGTYNGFKVTLYRHYHLSLWEIWFPGGLSCVDISRFVPDPTI